MPTGLFPALFLCTGVVHDISGEIIEVTFRAVESDKFAKFAVGDSFVSPKPLNLNGVEPGVKYYVFMIEGGEKK